MTWGLCGEMVGDLYLGVGHCHTHQSSTNEKTSACRDSKHRSRRKIAGTEEQNLCGGVAALKVPKGWVLFTIERYESPPCPTLSPCMGSGAYH